MFIEKKNFFKKNFMVPFLWMAFNCLTARATSRRQFTYSWKELVTMGATFKTVIKSKRSSYQ